MFDIKGQVILITGSSRGIGRAIAERAAEAGAKVVISSRKQDACDAVAEEIRAKGGEALAIAANVSDKGALENLVGQTLSAWGRIDCLICNAAVNPHYGPLSTIDDTAWDKIMGANLRSNLWLANLVLPGMAERGGGSMILLSSVVGLRGNSSIGAYGISKTADLGLTRNLAVEWGEKNIRVNAICPGIIKTDFAQALWDNPKVAEPSIRATCLKRLGDPDDIAGVALFLASPASRYVTGTEIVADGGMTISLAM
ncbi:SDR family NAD(P)-dependent oxidoreductase [Rhodovibrionaceae bacterium A322]